MSNEVYSVWHDAMKPPNAGAIGTPGEPVNDVVASMKVPDGLWMVFGRIEVNNNEPKSQMVAFALTGGGFSQPHDVARVKLGPQAQDDYDSVALMVPMHFPGTRTHRVNNIFLGLYDTGPAPDILVGRAKITAMRVDGLVLEPSPGG